MLIGNSSKRQESPAVLCFWSWNDRIDEDEIRRQLNDFSMGRFSGVIIHSRAGLRMQYMGEQWFRLYRAALEECDRLGLEAWIYDEDGWPSGFAGGRVPSLGEEYWMKTLRWGDGGEAPAIRRIAAFRPEREASGTEERVGGPFRRVDPQTARPGDLVFWYDTDSHYVDLLNPKTTQAFLSFTHEVYRQHFSAYFGRVIKGVFTDEPQVSPFPWSQSLETAFRETCGYELIDFLPLLTGEYTGFLSFRRDFRRVVSEQLKAAFTQPVSAWCEKNGLMMTGHFSGEDGLYTQMTANAGVMTQYTVMQTPGIDHLGNRQTSPVLAKQAASIARQYGRRYTLSETFGCSGWDISFAQMCWIWGRQSALGITTPCFHLSAYSIMGRRKRDYPAFFSYQEPWWDDFSALTAWMNHLNSLMTEGERVVDTLVVAPLSSVAATFDVNPNGRFSAERYSNEFRELAENLLDIQMDYDFGEESVMASEGAVENGRLTVGRVTYKTVLVSECLTLEASTIALLRRFAEQGGRVAFIGGRPTNVGLKPSSEAWDISGDTLQNRRDMLEKWALAREVERPVRVIRADTGLTARGVILHLRRTESGLRLHLWTDKDFNGNNAALRIESLCGLAQVDLQTQARKPVTVKHADGAVLVPLDLQPGGNFVFETTPLSVAPEMQIGADVRSWMASPVSVILTAPNSLTLDFARVSYNGEPFSPPKSVVRILDEIYARRERSGGKTADIRLEYPFGCSSDWTPGILELAIEDEAVREIAVNGHRVEKTRQGWWIDRCIGLYNIAPLVVPGDNRIMLRYELPAEHRSLNVLDGFETERNRFFYPVEPDSIYLRGMFDVQPIERTEDCLAFYRVEDKGFLLMPPTTKKNGDLTGQGLWFYRGDAVYSFLVEKPDNGRRLILEPVGVQGTFVHWQTEHGSGYLLQPPFAADITDALRPGENHVSVRVAGTNRNLMGPHHHLRGTTRMVGPSTFLGVRGFEDFVSPEIQSSSTWTDSYTMIPFGCRQFRLTEREAIPGRLREKSEEPQSLPDE